MSTLPVNGIEDAIDAYIKDSGAADEFTTGWILISSISSSSLDNSGNNGYAVITSSGLPHHAQIGLLSMALQDKQASVTVSAMYQIGEAIDFDEDDE